MRWPGGEERCTQILVRKPDGKGELGRPKRRWVVKIKIDLQGIGLIWPWRGTSGGLL
jgi:hypothetical protein